VKQAGQEFRRVEIVDGRRETTVHLGPGQHGQGRG
jgi:hypothetical protein